MTTESELNNVFRYEYNENEGLVSIFAKDTLVAELSDEDGSPEDVFNWFVTAYSKVNLALNYSCTGDCVNPRVNEIKAEAVMTFVNTQIGAFESGFVETNQVSLYSMYRFAQHHVKDSYVYDARLMSSVWGEKLAKEARSPEEKTIADCDLCDKPANLIARGLVTHDFGEYKYSTYGNELYRRCNEHKVEIADIVVKGDTSILPDRYIKRMGKGFIDNYNKNIGTPDEPKT